MSHCCAKLIRKWLSDKLLSGIKNNEAINFPLWRTLLIDTTSTQKQIHDLTTISCISDYIDYYFSMTQQWMMLSFEILWYILQFPSRKTRSSTQWQKRKVNQNFAQLRSQLKMEDPPPLQIRHQRRNRYMT